MRYLRTFMPSNFPTYLPYLTYTPPPLVTQLRRIKKLFHHPARLRLPCLEWFPLFNLPMIPAEDTLLSDNLRVTQSESHEEQYVTARL